MRSPSQDLRTLERLMPMENGVTVFDAETQETSYGICFCDDMPYIFDTHRKEGRFVATLELLTEVVHPVRTAPARIGAFCAAARRVGVLPIPYTGCFFKQNLHVYSFAGPMRGFDLSVVGESVAATERTLQQRVSRLLPLIPRELARAQQDLLTGRRMVRHSADLEVLVRRRKEEPSGR